jgi:hypothetical protein
VPEKREILWGSPPPHAIIVSKNYSDKQNKAKRRIGKRHKTSKKGKTNELVRAYVQSFSVSNAQAVHFNGEKRSIRY